MALLPFFASVLATLLARIALFPHALSTLKKDDVDVWGLPESNHFSLFAFTLYILRRQELM